MNSEHGPQSEAPQLPGEAVELGTAEPEPDFQPAEQRQFADLADFQEHLNSFSAFFLSQGIVSEGYRNQAVYQRFAQKYPELEQAVRAAFAEPQSMQDWSRGKWELLYEAYQKMSGLVDRRDAGVVGENDQIDPDFLTR